MMVRDERVIAAPIGKEILADVSNQLRTDVNGLLGINSLLLAMDLDSKQKHYARLIRDSARSLLHTVSNMIDYTAIRGGELCLLCEDVNFRKLLDEVMQSYTCEIYSKEIALVYFVDPKIPSTFCGDYKRLHQLLTNLISCTNAFAHDGIQIIRVNLEHCNETDSTVRFEIIASVTNALRDGAANYSSLDSSSPQSATGQGAGSRLDLEICRRLTNMMGGHLHVVSNRDDEYAISATVRLNTVVTEQETPSILLLLDRLRCCRILMVDPNRQSREVCQEQFEAWQVPIVIVSDGQSALDQLRKGATDVVPFDMVIIDETIVDISCNHLAQLIQCDQLLAGIAVMLAASPHGASNMLNADYDACIVKPLWQLRHMEILVDALQHQPESAQSIEGQDQEHTAAEISSNGDACKIAPHILVAEDDRINQIAIQGILAQHGYSCDVAASGKDVIKMALMRNYDLILMDCQMSQMDGYEATKTIRQMEQDGTLIAQSLSSIPIIALTGNALEGDRKRCIDAGMDDYLTKPIDPNQLFSAIESQLSDSNARGACLRDNNTFNTPSALSNTLNPEPAKYMQCVVPDTFDSQIDISDALNRCIGDSEFLIQMLSLFSVQTETFIDKLEEAIRLEDRDAIASIAHTLKGSAANVSAVGIRDSTAELERITNDNDLVHAKEQLSVIRKRYEQFCNILPEAIKTLAKPGSPPALTDAMP